MGKFNISKEKAFELIKNYGSPLYIYDEGILRKRCQELKNLLSSKNFHVNYSAKANTNLELLKIVNEEGLDVDAMSPGEIFIEEKAGFTPDRIFYISNNVSAEEMRLVIDKGIMVSVDSLSQLELYGQINPDSKVAVRFNPGVGIGHHDKVKTGGKKTKFAVQRDFIPLVKVILKKYNLTLAGINQHMGSLFMNGDKYLDGVENLFEIAKEFPGLEFIDIGGGFGIPYELGEDRLNLNELGQRLDKVYTKFLAEYDNKDLILKIEPGRYIVAECGVLLGKTYSVKENYGMKYIGTDLGFNVLMRPMLYESYHEIKVLKYRDNVTDIGKETVNIVGNICESGDIVAQERELPIIDEGDIIAVMDTGAYGFVMSSNYNCRLRPAEVLIDRQGNDRLIRKRETYNDLLRNF